MVTTRPKVLIDGIFLGVNPASVKISEQRVIASQQVPGREGDVLQDMGSSPATISMEGKIFAYPTAEAEGTTGQSKETILMELRTKLMSGGVKSVTASLLNPLNTTEYLVENFDYSEVGGRPFEYTYSLSLKQYTKTVLKVNQVYDVNKEAFDQAIQTLTLERDQAAIQEAYDAGGEDAALNEAKSMGAVPEDTELMAKNGGFWDGVKSVISTIGGWFS